jgi:hypothetical protein
LSAEFRRNVDLETLRDVAESIMIAPPRRASARLALLESKMHISTVSEPPESTYTAPASALAELRTRTHPVRITFEALRIAPPPPEYDWVVES